jgi:hypothetical protein
MAEMRRSLYTPSSTRMSSDAEASPYTPGVGGALAKGAVDVGVAFVNRAETLRKNVETQQLGDKEVEVAAKLQDMEAEQTLNPNIEGLRDGITGYAKGIYTADELKSHPGRQRLVNSFLIRGDALDHKITDQVNNAQDTKTHSQISTNMAEFSANMAKLDAEKALIDEALANPANTPEEINRLNGLRSGLVDYQTDIFQVFQDALDLRSSVDGRPLYDPTVVEAKREDALQGIYIGSFMQKVISQDLSVDDIDGVKLAVHEGRTYKDQHGNLQGSASHYRDTEFPGAEMVDTPSKDALPTKEAKDKLITALTKRQSLLQSEEAEDFNKNQEHIRGDIRSGQEAAFSAVAASIPSATAVTSMRMLDADTAIISTLAGEKMVRFNRIEAQEMAVVGGPEATELAAEELMGGTLFVSYSEPGIFNRSIGDLLRRNEDGSFDIISEVFIKNGLVDGYGAGQFEEFNSLIKGKIWTPGIQKGLKIKDHEPDYSGTPINVNIDAIVHYDPRDYLESEAVYISLNPKDPQAGIDKRNSDIVLYDKKKREDQAKAIIGALNPGDTEAYRRLYVSHAGKDAVTSDILNAEIDKIVAAKEKLAKDDPEQYFNVYNPEVKKAWDQTESDPEFNKMDPRLDAEYKQKWNAYKWNTINRVVQRAVGPDVVVPYISPQAQQMFTDALDNSAGGEAYGEGVYNAYVAAAELVGVDGEQKAFDTVSRSKGKKGEELIDFTTLAKFGPIGFAHLSKGPDITALRKESLDHPKEFRYDPIEANKYLSPRLQSMFNKLSTSANPLYGEHEKTVVAGVDAGEVLFLQGKSYPEIASILTESYLKTNFVEVKVTPTSTIGGLFEPTSFIGGFFSKPNSLLFDKKGFEKLPSKYQAIIMDPVKMKIMETAMSVDLDIRESAHNGLPFQTGNMAADMDHDLDHSANLTTHLSRDKVPMMTLTLNDTKNTLYFTDKNSDSGKVELVEMTVVEFIDRYLPAAEYELARAEHYRKQRASGDFGISPYITFPPAPFYTEDGEYVATDAHGKRITLNAFRVKGIEPAVVGPSKRVEWSPSAYPSNRP